jgi:hypothetical protein
MLQAYLSIQCLYNVENNTMATVNDHTMLKAPVLV